MQGFPSSRISTILEPACHADACKCIQHRAKGCCTLALECPCDVVGASGAPAPTTILLHRADLLRERYSANHKLRLIADYKY